MSDREIIESACECGEAVHVEVGGYSCRKDGKRPYHPGAADLTTQFRCRKCKEWLGYSCEAAAFADATPPASHDAGEADQLKALAYAMLAHGYGKDSQLVIGAAERIATLTAELAEARAEVERLREAARSAATDIVDGYYKTAGQTLYYALSASGREGE